jgi:eukaryotic-like serine/threonine-protein kinase
MAARSRDPDTTARPDVIAPWLPAIGNWQLVELLGQGRWCKVYRARPIASIPDGPADYAVKLAKQPAASDALAIRLLRREAAVAADVSHPHLTSMLSARVRRPPHYLVMPYLIGQTLESLLARQGKLPVSRAAGIALQTAQAMSALHQRGWIHSDIKPGNILVGVTGHVTLLDLGLARKSGGAGGGDGSALAGTLAYTPPESFGSLVELGPAMDVYSLGVTLYRMVTGVLPFPQTDPAAVAAAHLHHQPPAVRLANPALDVRIVNLLDRMLDKHPDRRVPDGELLAELTELEIAPADHRVAA